MAETDKDLYKSINDFVNSNFLMGSGAIKFSNDDSLIEKGIIDSTGILEMVNFIQKNFGIKINDEDLIPENLDSINSIASFITRKKGRERDNNAPFELR